MNIKELWSNLTQESSTEVHRSPLLRKMGFAGVMAVDLVINANFYASIAESWIMPIAGLILVFMKVWNWVSAQTASKLRKILHYGAWICLAVMSVIAAVSFGMAVTTATTGNIDQIIGLQNLKNSSLTTQVSSWIKERTALTDTIIQLNAEIASLTGERADWNRTKAADQASLKQANQRATELDNLIKNAGTDSKGKAVKQEALINAQLVFSQVFSNKGAPLAIKIFFFIFGIAIELTLALSSLPNTKGILLNRTTEPENVATVTKQKRAYTRREKKTEPSETLGTGVSEGQSATASSNTITGDPEDNDIPERSVLKLAPEDYAKVIKHLQNPPEPTKELKELMNPKKTKDPSINDQEEVPIRPIPTIEERFVRALYNNEELPYLKDKIVASVDASVSIPDALKIFDSLSSMNGPTGTKYIEFRTTTSKWYPNYTSELILNLLKDNKIKLL